MAFLQFMKTNAKNVIDLAGVLVVLFSYARSQESKKTRSRLLSIGIRYTQEQSPAKYNTNISPYSSSLLSSFPFFASSCLLRALSIPSNPQPAVTDTQQYIVLVSLGTFHLPISDYSTYFDCRTTKNTSYQIPG